jgi:hypothetical protein
VPSLANSHHLEALLLDASELGDAHTRLRTGSRGRQWGLGAINRAAVVLCVSAWESYVEEVTKEGLEAMRPAGISDAAWAVVKAAAMAQIQRFNTPNASNTRSLFLQCLSLPDVTAEWYWRNCSSARARGYLDNALRIRHQIAHGVNPRPTIHNGYSGWLPSFFRNLARCTDQAIATHAQQLTGAALW